MPWRLRGDENSLGDLKIPIDVIPTLRYILLVLFDEGRFLEAILQRAERKLVGPGPRTNRQA
jgi:hypothetical protein